MKVSIIPLIAFAFVLSACNAEFDLDDAITNGLSASGDIDPETLDDIPGDRSLQEVLDDFGETNENGEVELPAPIIEKLCSSFERQSHRQDISFAPPGRTCEWNQGGNQGPVNYFFQARIEQQEPLNVPEGAILCSMRFNFPAQSFLYDDHFMLNLNRTVIASSYNWSGILDNGVNGLYTYNWDSVVGNVWDTTQETIYCATISGAVSSCTFPDSDMTGIIDLDLSTRHIESSMANGIPLAGHYFQMVTIGDNDALDCEHTGMDFTVDVSYIQ